MNKGKNKKIARSLADKAAASLRAAIADLEKKSEQNGSLDGTESSLLSRLKNSLRLMEIK